MEDGRMKKKARSEDLDKISKLSDDVIHHIMSFWDIRDAVRTSLLSKRWKLVWTTLPFLNFKGYAKPVKPGEPEKPWELSKYVYSKLFNHVISRRNRHCRILKLDLCPIYGLNLGLTKKVVKYAINHNVERLNVESAQYCSLSVFKSNTLKVLELTMKFKPEKVMGSDCWTLPNLTTLICKCTNSNYYQQRIYKLPVSCLIGLSALKKLCLNQCDLPDFISLPSLTTLYLESCMLPKTVWEFPALSTLELVDMFFPKNMREYFLALASLQNLTIDLGSRFIGCCDISSSRLMNLKLISSPLKTASDAEIVVQAPKLCNFEAVGFFRMKFEGLKLENVDIKFWDCTMYKNGTQLWRMKPELFKIMFSQLGSTKILSLDLLTLQALSLKSDILVHLDSPFYNLKYMKLPHGCEESSISSSVRRYLLGGSPSAAFVKTLSRDNVSPQMDLGVGSIAQDVLLREPLVTPTKDMINYQPTCKNTCATRGCQKTKFQQYILTR